MKYYKSFATMFNINEGLGNGGNSSFLVIALDDSAGKMPLGAGDSVEITFDSRSISAELVGDSLNLTGTPPLSFRASVVSGTP